MIVTPAVFWAWGKPAVEAYFEGQKVMDKF
jgi:hypothetical protein